MIKNEIVEYNPLVAAFFEGFAKTTAHIPKATPQDVAATIFAAVIDGKPQLRYMVGDDTRFYFDLRRQHTDDEYVKQMRAFLTGAH